MCLSPLNRFSGGPPSRQVPSAGGTVKPVAPRSRRMSWACRPGCRVYFTGLRAGNIRMNRGDAPRWISDGGADQQRRTEGWGRCLSRAQAVLLSRLRHRGGARGGRRRAAGIPTGGSEEAGSERGRSEGQWEGARPVPGVGRGRGGAPFSGGSAGNSHGREYHRTISVWFELTHASATSSVGAIPENQDS